MVVFGLGKDLSFKSVLGRCVVHQISNLFYYKIKNLIQKVSNNLDIKSRSEKKVFSLGYTLSKCVMVAVYKLMPYSIKFAAHRGVSANYAFDICGQDDICGTGLSGPGHGPCVTPQRFITYISTYCYRVFN